MADTTTTLATVEFHGAHLVTTLVDGVPHVALRPICEAVGLDWNGQYQRLMRHAVLAPTVCMTHTVDPCHPRHPGMHQPGASHPRPARPRPPARDRDPAAPARLMCRFRRERRGRASPSLVRL